MAKAATFAAAILAGIGLAAHAAKALVTLNDGTDKVFVSGNFSMAIDSNVGASAANTKDTVYSGGVGLEYQRRAGLIGVVVLANYSLNRFAINRAFNSTNPSYSIEFDKSTGRTTGTLNISAQRTSQADVAANVHDVSWNINTGINLRYPVIQRYSFTGSFNYGMLRYTETGGQPLINLNTFTGAVGVFYVLNEQRDLFANYRYRRSQTSSNTSTVDHALSAGVNGKLIWIINGTLSVGYQIRLPHGVVEGETIPQSSYRSFTAAGTAAMPLMKRAGLSATISKDFATTSTNATTDTTALALSANYTVNAKTGLNASTGYGWTTFLGPFGVLSDGTTHRSDHYFTWSTGASYTYSKHINTSVTYAFFRNWSNLQFASFKRNSLTWSVSSRW